jgi:hypothetical protein
METEAVFKARGTATAIAWAGEALKHATAMEGRGRRRQVGRRQAAAGAIPAPVRPVPRRAPRADG